ILHRVESGQNVAAEAYKVGQRWLLYRGGPGGGGAPPPPPRLRNRRGRRSLGAHRDNQSGRSWLARIELRQVSRHGAKKRDGR
ncbi:hypothetical protein ABMZ06_30145, partial [Pseudomonas aeruginosa]